MSVAGALCREPFTLHGVGLIDIKHVTSFFSEYHAILAAMGVDGVKVDAQSVLPLLEDERADGTNIPLLFHQALQNSVRNAFSWTKSGEEDISPSIHCMAHSQGTLLNISALYGSDREIAVIRGSDDFWPNEEASHGPHLYANAMNSLFISHIGLHDWDMFKSDLGKPSAMHAASRAISRGPRVRIDPLLTMQISYVKFPCQMAQSHALVAMPGLPSQGGFWIPKSMSESLSYYKMLIRAVV